MKESYKVNIFKIFFNIIIVLIIIKLLFSYLSVKVHYFQTGFTSNFESFNFLGLPQDFSNKIEYLLLPLLLIFIFQYSKYFKYSKTFLIISFCFYLLNIITSIVNNTPFLESLIFSLKIFTPIYFFNALIIYHNKTGVSLKSILLKFIFICLFLISLALLFFNTSLNRLQIYLPIYFDSIHTHSYVLVSIFIALGYLIYREHNRYFLFFYLVISFLFLYLGYNVRTAVIMYLIYMMVMLFLISDIFKILILKALVFLPLFTLLFLLTKWEIDWVDFSSGRIAMYEAKWNQLMNFGFFDWIFGQGPGSDLIKTDIWWWDKKGAHSDIITIIVENGIIYLILFLLVYYFLIQLTSKGNIIFLAIIFGSLFSSLISNGIVVRPHANYVYYLVLAYIYTDLKSRRIDPT